MQQQLQMSNSRALLLWSQLKPAVTHAQRHAALLNPTTPMVNHEQLFSQENAKSENAWVQ